MLFNHVPYIRCPHVSKLSEPQLTYRIKIPLKNTMLSKFGWYTLISVIQFFKLYYVFKVRYPKMLNILNLCSWTKITELGIDGDFKIKHTAS